MTEETKHTTGEWIASGNGVHVFEGSVGKCVAIAHSPTDNRAEAHANAKRIALAVNCHDDLLAACNSALEKMRSAWDDTSVGPEFNSDDHADLVAAIAKATGKDVTPCPA